MIKIKPLYIHMLSFAILELKHEPSCSIYIYKLGGSYPKCNCKYAMIFIIMEKILEDSIGGEEKNAIQR